LGQCFPTELFPFSKPAPQSFHGPQSPPLPPPPLSCHVECVIIQIMVRRGEIFFPRNLPSLRDASLNRPPDPACRVALVFFCSSICFSPLLPFPTLPHLLVNFVLPFPVHSSFLRFVCDEAYSFFYFCSRARRVLFNSFFPSFVFSCPPQMNPSAVVFEVGLPLSLRSVFVVGFTRFLPTSFHPLFPAMPTW